MKDKVLNFLFATSSHTLRRKQIRTLWVAIGLGLVVAVIIGGLLYWMNRVKRM